VVGDARRVMTRGAIKLVSAIMDCEKPVLAAVQGTAAGIGAHVAFACDPRHRGGRGEVHRDLRPAADWSPTASERICCPG